MQKMNEASGLTIKEMCRQDRHTGWFPGTEKNLQRSHFKLFLWKHRAGVHAILFSMT